LVKKTFIFIALLWVGFLGYIVLKKPVDEVVEEPASIDPVVQSSEPATQYPPVQQKTPDTTPDPEVIPFVPLPDKMKVSEKDEVKPDGMAKTEEKKEVPPVERKRPDLENSFGLICTKFEKIPSRFRMSSWEGTKKIELEDLSRIDSSTKNHPKFWIKVRVPYKELVHPSSGDSFFKPTSMNDPNKRIIVQSFEVRNEALSYTNRTKPIGYLILKDFKIGGPSYQITSEMDSPLSSSYYIHFEQVLGAQKFFHDLTGKRNGHPFGGWGYEYKITRKDFSQNKINVVRKDLKTRSSVSKELDGPTSL
jgi:hypothetical protein